MKLTANIAINLFFNKYITFPEFSVLYLIDILHNNNVGLRELAGSYFKLHFNVHICELCKRETDTTGVLATRRLQSSDNSERPRGFAMSITVLFSATRAQMPVC